MRVVSRFVVWLYAATGLVNAFIAHLYTRLKQLQRTANLHN
jgi:hypothetical protein